MAGEPLLDANAVIAFLAGDAVLRRRVAGSTNLFLAVVVVGELYYGASKDEIRRVRHRISEEFGHDPRRLVEHYMNLQDEKYAERLVRSAPSQPATGAPGALTLLECEKYLKYYRLETYLFSDVHDCFENDGSIGAFDFFSIVVWKANRAKSKIARNLLRRSKGGASLEEIVRGLTRALKQTPDQRERLRLLWQWDFRLPMASAILTALWPDDFTVYDVRVCGELRKDGRQDYCRLAGCTSFDKLWEGYSRYIEAAKTAVPGDFSLRDKDRYLWGRSARMQLEEDIRNEFRARDTSSG
jgi:hypothetical protein